jgi:N-acetyl-beta-hexosaminidase
MLRSEIIPTPKQIEISEETVLLDTSWGIADRSDVPGLARVFAEGLGVKLVQGRKNVALQADAALAEEEYRVEVVATEVTVAAASRRGFLHALSTLKQLCNGPLLSVAKVHDYPRLPMRGLQLMFESFVQMKAKEALGLIESAGKLKLNTMLLEFGDRFPFEKHSAIRSASSLARAEVAQMVETCDALGIQPIPLLQSLGHLRYMLKHDEYADIREERDKPDQMCPTNEKSFRMWTEMAEEVLALFPGCKLMHIGADETRQLGVCPRCKAQAEKTGKA